MDNKRYCFGIVGSKMEASTYYLYNKVQSLTRHWEMKFTKPGCAILFFLLIGYLLVLQNNI